MALETSPEHPAPVRQITQAIGQWIDRLGAVWVEGQVDPDQPPRRDEHRLPDPARQARRHLRPGHLQPRRSSTRCPPRWSRARRSSCHAKPSFYPNRGTLSLQVREIRLVGEGELLARLERRRQLLAAEGLFAEELKRPLPFLPAQRRPGHRAELRRRARRPGERPAALARRALHGAGTPRCRACIAAREVIEALQPLDRDPDVDVIVDRPRRRLGRGPAAVLRRGA